jgi:hypothetical protein
VEADLPAQGGLLNGMPGAFVLASPPTIGAGGAGSGGGGRGGGALVVEATTASASATDTENPGAENVSAQISTAIKKYDLISFPV